MSDAATLAPTLRDLVANQRRLVDKFQQGALRGDLDSLKLLTLTVDKLATLEGVKRDCPGP